VHVLFDTLVTSIEHIRANELRALAVTSPTRVAVLPDVPAVAEVVPGYQADGWQGLAAPANISVEIVDKLNRQINSALADPRFAARIADLGGVPFVTSPAEFRNFVADYTAKWSRLIKSANISR
jgi:tripartite-type tricarboxylate transporter receptor subunit TctC